MRFIPPTLALLVVLNTADAQNHLVAPSGAFPTIQSAIDAAMPGDFVDVPGGVYSEAVDLLGKELTLRALAGPDLTIIGGPQRKIRARSGETRNTVVEGFTFVGVLGGAWSTIELQNSGLTLRNCRFDSIGTSLPQLPGSTFAPAITSTNSDLVIDLCVFENCVAASAADSTTSVIPVAGASGGAVHVSGGTVEVLACIFQGNRAGRGGSDFGQSTVFNQGTRGGHGGAIAIHGATAVIRNSLFDGNQAGSGGLDFAPSPVLRNGLGGNGGAIWATHLGQANASLEIDRCYFLDNETGRQQQGNLDLEGSGGALHAETITVRVEASFFCGNGANLGGAIAQRSDLALGLGTCDLTNSIFVGNAASGHGGACHLTTPCDADLRHNVFVGNGAALGAALFVASGAPGTLRFDHNIMQSSWGNDLDGSEGPALPGVDIRHNLSDQPLVGGVGNIVGSAGFVDPAALDFRLRADSPCVDAGERAATTIDRDYDGEARPFGAAVDIGADEFVGLSPVAAGTAVDAQGLPLSLLSLDGEDGGATRHLVRPLGSPSSWVMDALPESVDADHFILWGRIGLPAFDENYLLRFLGAELCFTPHLEDLGNPLLFTFANSFQPVGSGLVSAYPAPFAFPTFAIDFPVTITIQGLILSDDFQFRVTNALAVELR